MEEQGSQLYPAKARASLQQVAHTVRAAASPGRGDGVANTGGATVAVQP